MDRLRVATTTPATQPMEDVNEAEEASPSSPSVNFSRPMSPTPGTATTKKYTHKAGPWFTGGATPTRPMTADGVSQSRSTPTPINTAKSNEAESAMVYDPNTRSFIQKARAQPTQTSPTSPTMQPEMVYDPNSRSFVPLSQAPAPVETTEQTAPASSVKKARPIPPAVDTTLEPPPRNPARLSPTTSSPRSPRAAGVLQKHPSIVREDPEGEQEAEASTSKTAETASVQRSVQSSAPAKSYSTPGPHERSSSLDVPRTGSSAGRGRTTSVSPQRSAHFSPSPVLKPERHVPPPRDISPVKSALKQSPASSVRTASPVAVFSPLASAMSPPSETSEDTQSQDGLGSGKKKKSVHVSFDEQAKEIDLAPVTPKPVPDFDDDDDAVMKPRPALPSFGSVRKNRMQPEPAEKVTEMPPERHATSSDHALGGILRNSLEPIPPEVTSKESAGYISDESSDGEVPAVASAAAPIPATVGAGRDVAVASEPKVKDFAAIPVIEKSDESLDTDKADVPAIELQPPTPGLDENARRELGEQESLDVPPRSPQRNSMENIVVPGGWAQDEESSDKDTAPEVPSQPPTTAEQPPDAVRRASSEDSAATQSVTPMQLPLITSSPLELSDIDEDTDDAEFSDAVEDPSDLEDNVGFASLDAIVESPLVTPVATEKTRSTAVDSSPESPSAKQAAKLSEKNGATKAQTGNWNEATAYWSQLTKEKRQQLEREHLSSDDEAPPPAKTNTKPKSPATATVPARASTTTAARPSQQAPAQTTLRKTMRGQPGPAPTDDGVHLRSSMRSGGKSSSLRQKEVPPATRPQSEYIEPRGALQKKNIRPMSASGVSSMAGVTAQVDRPSSSGPTNQGSAYPTLATKSNSVQRKSEPPQVSARLQRELSHDSDSESSFKKRRRAGSGSVDAQGRYSMRRSMRGNSIDSTPSTIVEPARPTSPPTGGRNRGFSLRSLSPNGSFFGGRKPERPESAGTATRTTLRGPPAARNTGRTTLRASAPAPAPTARTTTAPTSRFKSRFVDSDDSDDDRPTRSFFKSRFADSDDEDEPTPLPAASGLRPVRGIPRKAGQDDGDSTDLEDEEDNDPRKASRKREKMATPLVPSADDVEKAMAAARRNLGVEKKQSAQESQEGDVLRKGTLRSKPAPEEAAVATSAPSTPMEGSEKKKRGFMGSILRRNRHSSASIQQVPRGSVPPSPALPNTVSPAVAAPQSTGVTSPMRPSSPASPSPGKLIRRRSDQPQLRRGDSDYSTATAPVMSSPRANDSDNWPLPPPVPPIPTDDGIERPITDTERPNTSDGVSPSPAAIKLAQTMRPELAPRSKSGHQLGNRVRIEGGPEGSEPGEREKDQGVVYSRRTGKKKKFGMLRRAFGLND